MNTLVTEVQKKLQARIYKQRMEPQLWFQDYDIVNRGRARVDNFIRGLQYSGVPLSEQEINSIVAAYSVENKGETLVKWREFCSDLNEVFAPKTGGVNLKVVNAKQFLRDYEEKSAADFRCKSRAALTVEDKQELNSIIDTIRGDVKDRRIIIKSYLVDHDKLHLGHMPAASFRRTLSTLGWNLNDDQMELLNWKYVSATHSDEINYRAFLADVDPPLTEGHVPFCASIAARTPSEKKMEVKENEVADADYVIRKLQTESVRNRLHFRAFFIDYDKVCFLEVHLYLSFFCCFYLHRTFFLPSSNTPRLSLRPSNLPSHSNFTTSLFSNPTAYILS